MRTDELEEHLRAAAAAQPDVHDPRPRLAERMRHRRRVRRAGMLTAIAVVVLAAGVLVWSPWTPSHQRVTVAGEGSDSTASSSASATDQQGILNGVTVRFTKPVGGRLPGDGIGASFAVPTSAGDKVFYVTDGSDGTELRVVDVRTGTDGPLLAGAYAPALNASGTRLAYGKAAYGATKSELWVRDLTTNTDTKVGQYDGIVQPLFWAADTLVSQRLRDSASQPELDAEFLLPTGATVEQPFTFVKAVNDDGTRVLVHTASPDAYLQVLAVPSLEPVAAMTVGQFIDGYVPADQAATIPHDRIPDTAEEPGLPVALGDNLGAWAGTDIVLPAVPAPAVVHADGGTLTAAGLVPLPRSPSDDVHVESVRAVDVHRVYIDIDALVSPSVITCDLPARTCSAPAGDQGVRIWNASRGERTTPVGPETCGSNELRLALGDPVSEATGQRSLSMTLTNAGSRTCALEGYPDVQLIDATGGRLPVDYSHTGDQMVTSEPPTRVELSPGGVAYALINKYRCDGGDQQQAATVVLTPPGSQESMEVQVQPGLSIDLAYCGDGDPGSIVAVSPIEPTLATAAQQH